MQDRKARIKALDNETEKAFRDGIVDPVVTVLSQEGGTFNVDKLDDLVNINNHAAIQMQLALDDCAVNPEAPQLIAQAIQNNPEIRLLSLDLGHLDPRKAGDIKQIMDAVKAIPNLEFLYLDLSRMNLDTEEVACIAETVTGCKNLIGLHLGMRRVNNITVESMISLLSAIRVAKPVFCDVELSSPGFDSEAVDRVLASLKSNTCITRFEFDDIDTPQQESIRAMCIVRNQLLFKYRDNPELCESLLKLCEKLGHSSDKVPSLVHLTRLFIRSEAGSEFFDKWAKSFGGKNIEARKDIQKLQDVLSPEDATVKLLEERDDIESKLKK